MLSLCVEKKIINQYKRPELEKHGESSQNHPGAEILIIYEALHDVSKEFLNLRT